MKKINFMPLRVKLFIVTYNANAALMTNLENIFKCLEEPDISIINNHNISISGEISQKYPTIKVYENVMRHPNSHGHLSRSWNQCLLFGFGSANRPDADWVVGMQDDLIIDYKFWEIVQEQMNCRDFIMVGPGDQIWLSNVAAILKIGFWDEHFMSIAYQEADYYHRAYLQLKDRCILEDYLHQPEGPNLITNNSHNLKYLIRVAKYESSVFMAEHSGRQNNHVLHNFNKNYFMHKWTTTLEPHNFEISKNLSNPIPGDYCFYPWFYV